MPDKKSGPSKPKPPFGTGVSEYRREIVAEGTMSVKGAMAFTGMGRRTIEDAIRRGALPIVRLGRRIAIPKRALVQFLAERLELRRAR